MSAGDVARNGTLPAAIASRVILAAIVPLFLVAFWEVSARRGISPDYLSSPTEIIQRGAELALSGQLWLHAWASLSRALGGLFVGASLGIASGCLAGHSRTAGSFLDPLISVIYPVPKIAFLPILIVWLGLGEASKIAAVALSVFFPVFINAFNGARSVRKHLIWAARTMGASRARIFFHVVFPASVPSIFSGVRIGLGLSFIVIFATELVGARTGLGYLISLAEVNQQFDVMLAAIMTISLLGLLFDRLLLFVRHRVLEGKTE